MAFAIAGPSLILRTSALLNGSSKLILSNKITHGTINPSSVRLKSDAKSLIANYKIPEKPKRPLTAYFSFLVEKRPIITKQNPSMSNAEIVKLMAEQWKTMSADLKAKYEEQASQEKTRYDNEILEYNAKLTPEQEKILRQIQSDKKKDKQKRKFKQESKAEGKPKKSLSAFGLFVAENVSAGKLLTEVMSTCKDQWAKMSSVEKEKYYREYQKSKEQYDREMEAWEAKMIKKGKSHLVRVKSRKAEPSKKKTVSKSKSQ